MPGITQLLFSIKLTGRLLKYCVPPVMRFTVTGKPARSHIVSVTIKRMITMISVSAGIFAMLPVSDSATYAMERAAPRKMKGR